MTIQPYSGVGWSISKSDATVASFVNLWKHPSLSKDEVICYLHEAKGLIIPLWSIPVRSRNWYQPSSNLTAGPVVPEWSRTLIARKLASAMKSWTVACAFS
jgi:hypothetical protein